jgi:uncharacterized membrane protein (UPF0136 family)
MTLLGLYYTKKAFTIFSMRRRRAFILRISFLTTLILGIAFITVFTQPSILSGVLFFLILGFFVFFASYFLSGERILGLFLALGSCSYLGLRALRIDSYLNVGLLILVLVLLWVYFKD